MPNKFYEQLQDQSEGDLVKVVRCKDCEYWGTRRIILDKFLEKTYGDCLNMDVNMREDFYCKWGTRKDAKTD